LTKYTKKRLALSGGIGAHQSRRRSAPEKCRKSD